MHDPSPPADDDAPDARRVEQALRWRLILGAAADEQLGFDRLSAAATGDLAALLGEARAIETPLSYLYEREHEQRSHRQAAQGGGSGL
ncbi:MAG: hypothetical protein KC620_05705, partial [Myxococcales bacterium]|nr:hypothetical protein [Myxococcales bacterium]